MVDKTDTMSLTYNNMNNVNSYTSKLSRQYPLCIAQACALLVLDKTQSKYIAAMGLIFRFGLLVFYILSFCLALTFDPTLSDNNPNILTICRIGNGIYVYFGMGTIINCYSLVTRKALILHRIFHRLFRIDRDFREIFGNNTKIEYCKQAINGFERLILSVLGLLLTMSTIFNIIVFRRLSGDIIFSYYFAYAYPYFLSTTITIQFVCMVKLIQLRFNLINESLQHILNNCETTSTAMLNYENPPEVPVIGVDKFIPVIFFFKRKSENKINDLNGDTKGLQNISHKNLRKLFQLHDELLDMAENVNQCYSTIPIAFTTSAFIYALFGLFFETKVLFWNGERNINLILIASSYVFWSAQGLLVIYILLNVCENTRGAAYETPLIVHKIVQKKPIFMLNDDNYYKKMKSFTIQVLHRKKTFNFTGLGLFNFDYTFIFSAVSAATSYLIVLLQFDVKFD